jgi:hypothetical protein
VQAGSGPEDNRQLFFSHAPLTATETHIKELFNQFGEVGSLGSAWCKVLQAGNAAWLQFKVPIKRVLESTCCFSFAAVPCKGLIGDACCQLLQR